LLQDGKVYQSYDLPGLVNPRLSSMA